MTKLKINLTPPVHECLHRVLYSDTDAGGVVYNANYLRYFELGRSEFMRDLVISYKEMEDQGYILPVVESYLRYKAPAHYDDMLLIKTAIQNIKEVSCRFNYQILRRIDNTLLVKGFTVHASVNRQGKLKKLPRDFIDRLINLTA
jgi:acyl-CoA thioester hydrolase